jgi:hypothetical protein
LCIYLSSTLVVQQKQRKRKQQHIFSKFLLLSLKKYTHFVRYF